MKTNKVFRCVLCAIVSMIWIHVQAQSTEFSAQFTSEKGQWYDLTGDGVLEFMSTGPVNKSELRVYQFKNNLTTSSELVNLYKNGVRHSMEGLYWHNLNNDNMIDAYYISSDYRPEVYLAGSGYSMNNIFSSNNSDYSTLVPVDINNDGFPDFVVNEETRQAEVAMLVNGEYISTKVKLLTPEDYAGIQKELKLTSSTGLSYNNVATSINVETVLASGIKSIDLNGDGYIDLVNPDDGSFYQNLGDGRYVKNSLGGVSTFRDFNNDGLMDVLVWDSENLKLMLYYSTPELTWGEKKIFSNFVCNDKLFCYDFDKDGDVDILVPFDQYHNKDSHDNGGSYLMLVENQGNNNFKIHEFALDGTLWFKDCFDMDGDGLFEISALKYKDVGEIGSAYDSDSTDLVLYEVAGLEITDTPLNLKESIGSADRYTKGYISENGAEFLFADVHNSGYTNLFYTKRVSDGTYGIKYFKDEIPTVAANSRPTAPATLNYIFDAATNQLKISWSEGTDKETSSVDLTYALRIGTEKDKGDILFAHANADGTRRNLLEGNCGYSRYRVLDVSSWKAGKYYISVQSVDPNCLGSEFGDYVVFEKKTPAADFILSYNDYFTIGDTCTVTLLNSVESGCTYHWDWGGGTVVGTNEDGSEYKIVFNEGGEKVISLYVESVEGYTSLEVEKTLNVNQTNIKQADYSNEQEKVFYAEFAMDLDENGTTEVFYSRKFYEGDATGNYTPIQKLWNSNLPTSQYSHRTIPTDINRDGKVDVAYYGYEEAYLLLNEDGQFYVDENVDELVTSNAYDTDCSFDFNNDGFIDLLYEGRHEVFVNDGTYQSYVIKEVPNSDFILDYDHDGLMDFIYRDYIYRNNGDFTFTESILPISESGVSFTGIADLDGDGTWDYLDTPKAGRYGVSYYYDTLSVYWGDASVATQIPCLNDDPYGAYYAITDVDNNGCLDVVISCKSKTQLVACYMDKDHNCKTEVIEGYWGSGLEEQKEFVTTDGKLVFNGLILSGCANEKPSAPTDLRAAQGGKFVTIEWNHSVDKETPATLMRYNISIKRKGQTGEGAYLISPLNSTKNGVSIPSTHQLLTGNKFTIPLAGIPAGEYEVQVQGIDRRYQESDFSEIYYLTVLEQSVIEMPTSIGVGKEVIVSVTTNSDDAIDFGEGATVVETSTGVYTVSWSTAGQKTVTISGIASQSIYVYPLPEANFTLPANILEGATVNFTGVNLSNGVWEYSLDGGIFVPVTESEIVTMALETAERASLVFNIAGEYQLRHTVTDDFNTVEYTVSTTVTETNSQPAITIVNIDSETGKHQINWSAAMCPADVESINIYKETTRSNVYELLANVPVTDNAYVDLASQPDVVASRYHITYVLPYGESQCSNDHQAIHVMINQGLSNTWNLNWSHYEGVEVESYRILGGTTTEDLKTIAEVSGHISSYSNIEAEAGMKYYAVEILVGTEAQPITRSSANMLSSRSNVISTDNVSVVNLITDIMIYSETGESVIEGAQGNTLQLYAYLYPFSATVREVDWNIIEGGDIATIDKNGLLTAIESGEVTVRATAVDGSGVFDEFTITLDLEANGISPENICPKNDIWPADIYDITGRMVRKGAISTEGLHVGLYFIKGKKVLVK